MDAGGLRKAGGTPGPKSTNQKKKGGDKSKHSKKKNVLENSSKKNWWRMKLYNRFLLKSYNFSSELRDRPLRTCGNFTRRAPIGISLLEELRPLTRDHDATTKSGQLLTS